MRYTVVWLRSAQAELADLWLNSEDRNSVTAAAAVIDATFAEDATTKGRELAEGLRKLYVPPLKVIFAVRDDDRTVEVLRVCML